MNLDQQVVNLQLAKRLKELGVKQDSLFYYQNNPYNDGEECIDLMITDKSSINNENVIINTQCENDDNPKYAAFTACELIDLLPHKIMEINFLEIVKSESNNYHVGYIDFDGCGDVVLYDSNLCNALAKTLIHLIETKFIETPK